MTKNKSEEKTDNRLDQKEQKLSGVGITRIRQK